MEKTTFNPMTAPLPEVLDWLAKRDGYKIGHLHGDGPKRWLRPRPDAGYDPIESCPITIDRLSGLLKKPWRWGIVQQRGDARTISSHGEWCATAVRDGAGGTIGCDRDTELEARARVVAAVLMMQ